MNDLKITQLASQLKIPQVWQSKGHCLDAHFVLLR